MNYYQKRTPVIDREPERRFAILFLDQIREVRGLIHHLETVAGINGKDFNPETVVDLRESKLIRILLHKALVQTDDEFIADGLTLLNHLLTYVRKHPTDINHIHKA